jgi:hypothetical protein
VVQNGEGWIGIIKRGICSMAKTQHYEEEILKALKTLPKEALPKV